MSKSVPLSCLKIFIYLFPLLSTYSIQAQPIQNMKLHSKSAILIDAQTKKVLYEKEAFKKHPPASITKISTLLYAVKKTKGSLLSKVTADQDCVGMITKEYRKKMKYNYPPHWNVVSGTHLSIKKNETLHLKDLLYGMMIASANDAANMVAKHLGGSIPNFMKDLNHFLKDIGCKHTHFKNPHGMHYPDHHTTAFDMALITIEGLKDPIFREIFKAKSYQLPKTNKQNAKKIVTYNKLLKPGQAYFRSFVIGSKSGFHDEAKNTLVAAAEKNGKVLVLVLLQCPSSHQKYEDALKLFNAGFKHLN